MKKINVMVVFGTRPETIKVAPVIKAMQSMPDKFNVCIVVTGQHKEMLEQSLSLFRIEPDMDLSLMSENQSLYDISTKALKGMEKALMRFKPDVVLVQGDTTTAFITALAAFYMKVPVGHIEAGLRTHNKYNPFPEEINRHLIGVVAEIHFAPTVRARENLLLETIKDKDIYITGNTAIDALFMTVDEEFKFDNPELTKLISSGRKIVTLTTHRRESFGEPMKATLRTVLKIADRYKDIDILFPVHYNPNVRAVVENIVSDHKRIHLVEPLDYENFVNLMAASYIILTDSGGIQEEAPSLGKPVLVLRETTERPEGVEAGTAKLVGTDPITILDEFSKLMDSHDAYNDMAKAVNPYGDGKASERIVDVLLQVYGEER